MEWDGLALKIQDWREFIKAVEATLGQHIRGTGSLDNNIIIDLIHGVHTFIPRGNRDDASSIVPFPSFEDHNPPWSEDEAVLGALITYALDLTLPLKRSEPLVNRKIALDDLTSDLINVLLANTTRPDVVTFAFWLTCRVSHQFRSRETVFTDIADIWHRMDEGIPKDYHKRLRLHATDAFIVVAPHYDVANNGLSVLTDHTALKWLSTAIESRHSLSTTIYTMAMILNLGTSILPTPVTSDIEVGSIIDALFSGLGDLEKGMAGEDVVDTQIYSTIILLKLPPTDELDVERVQGLIVQMEEAIGDTSTGDSGDTKGVTKSSEAGVGVDLDRARWKTIYLSALLLKFLLGHKREKHVEGLWARVRTLLGQWSELFVPSGWVLVYDVIIILQL